MEHFVGREINNRGSMLRVSALILALGATIGAFATLLSASDVLSPRVLAAGVVALFAIGVATLRRSVYAMLVFVAFAVMGVVALQPDPSDLLFVLLIAVGIVTGRVRLDNIKVFGPFNALVAAFVLCSIVSALVGEGSLGARVTFLGSLLAKVTFLYFLKGYINSADDVRRVLSGYATGGIIVALLAVVASQGLLTWSILVPTGDLRFRALMNDPNVFGSFFVPLTVVLLDEIIRPKLWKNRAMHKYVLLGLSGLSVLFSVSRGAWAGLAVALTVYTALVAGRYGLRRAVSVIAAIAVIAIVGMWMVVRLDYVSVLGARLGLLWYDADRFYFQRKSLELIAANGLGVGPGQGPVVVGYATHNLFLQVLLENGWFALLAMIVILGYVGLNLLRRILVRRAAPHGVGHEALLAILAGLVVNALFIDVLYWRIFWFVLGLAWVTIWPASDIRAVRRREGACWTS